MLNKIKHKIINELRSLLWELNFLGLFHNPKSNVVLMYHGIDDDSSREFNFRFCGVRDFEKQLKYFQKKYHIISLKEYSEKQFKSGKPNMAITFDDGYENWLTKCYPIVEKLNVPVTFFITSIRGYDREILWADLVDIAAKRIDTAIELKPYLFRNDIKRQTFVCQNSGLTIKEVLKNADWKLIEKVCDSILEKLPLSRLNEVGVYWRLLTREQIKKLAESPLVEIGSHSCFHTSLANIDVGEACRELAHSKEYLEEVIGGSITSLAYPSGSYSSEVIDISKRLGYQSQFVVDYLYGDETDDRILSRIGIYSHEGYESQILKHLR